MQQHKGAIVKYSPGHQERVSRFSEGPDEIGPRTEGLLHTLPEL